MFAYCYNNPVSYVDSNGAAPIYISGKMPLDIQLENGVLNISADKVIYADYVILTVKLELEIDVSPELELQAGSATYLITSSGMDVSVPGVGTLSFEFDGDQLVFSSMSGPTVNVCGFTVAPIAEWFGAGLELSSETGPITGSVSVLASYCITNRLHNFFSRAFLSGATGAPSIGMGWAYSAQAARLGYMSKTGGGKMPGNTHFSAYI